MSLQVWYSLAWTTAGIAIDAACDTSRSDRACHDLVVSAPLWEGRDCSSCSSGRNGHNVVLQYAIDLYIYICMYKCMHDYIYI